MKKGLGKGWRRLLRKINADFLYARSFFLLERMLPPVSSAKRSEVAVGLIGQLPSGLPTSHLTLMAASLMLTAPSFRKVLLLTEDPAFVPNQLSSQFQEDLLSRVREVLAGYGVELWHFGDFENVETWHIKIRELFAGARSILVAGGNFRPWKTEKKHLFRFERNLVLMRNRHRLDICGRRIGFIAPEGRFPGGAPAGTRSRVLPGVLAQSDKIFATLADRPSSLEIDTDGNGFVLVVAGRSVTQPIVDLARHPYWSSANSCRLMVFGRISDRFADLDPETFLGFSETFFADLRRINGSFRAGWVCFPPNYEGGGQTRRLCRSYFQELDLRLPGVSEGWSDRVVEALVTSIANRAKA